MRATTQRRVRVGAVVRQRCVAARCCSTSGGAASDDDGRRRSPRSPVPRQDPVALACEAAKLRSQLHETRRELAASRRELAAARASSAGTVGGGSGLAASSTRSLGLSRTLTEELASGRRRRRRFRILALDGGGVRGLFTAYVLGRLVKEEPRLMDSVDLIAGTSTGAIIGTLLAFEHTPEQIVEIYRDLVQTDNRPLFPVSCVCPEPVLANCCVAKNQRTRRFVCRPRRSLSAHGRGLSRR